MRRTAAAALVFAALLLFACARPISSPTALTSGQTAEQTGTVSLSPDLVKDGESCWRVVRPEVCSDTVLLAALSIDSHLFNRFGVHLGNKNDLAEPIAAEILVGLTNRPESIEVYETLEENRYAVKEVNGKIVLIGRNDRATAKAVEVFLSNWVDHAAKPSEGEKARVPMSIGEGKSGVGPN